MSADIIQFDKSKRHICPHLKGEAKCLACGHEWEEIILTGTVFFKCPECKLEKSVMKHPAAAADGVKRYMCACECEYFMFVQSKAKNCIVIVCACCGSHHPGSDIFS